MGNLSGRSSVYTGRPMIYYLIALDCHCQAPTIQKTVSFPIEVASNLVYIKGEVNGSGSLNAVLDTGASVSVVTPVVAKRLGLASSAAAKAAGLGEGRDETVKLVENADINWGPKLAGLHLAGQTIAVLPIDYLGQQTGHATEAIFGANLYSKFSITVDYDRQQATFGPGKLAQHAGTAVSLVIFDSAPYVMASLVASDGIRVSARFLLDTGTSGSLILNRKFLAAHPQITAGRGYVRVPKIDGVGGGIEAQDIRVPGLDFAGFALREPVAFVPDRPAGALVGRDVAGIIGAGILRRFVITWDYQSRKLWLVPTHHLGDKFEVDASGLHLVADLSDLRKIRVGAVQESSPAAQSDVQAGDVVLAVNGSWGLPLWQIASLLTHPGSTVTLLVSRNGTVSTRKIVLRRIV